MPTPCAICGDLFDLNDGHPCDVCNIVLCQRCASHGRDGWRCKRHRRRGERGYLGPDFGKGLVLIAILLTLAGSCVGACATWAVPKAWRAVKPAIHEATR